MRTRPRSTSWSTSLSPRPSMSIARRDGEMQQRLLALRRAEEAAGAARDRLVLALRRPPSRTPGTSSGIVEPVGLRARARASRTRADLRNHVAGAAHDDGVAAARRPCGGSRPRCAASRCTIVVPPTNTGFRRATGVSAPVRPTWTSMSEHLGGRFLGGKLVRDRPARRARDEAELLLLGEAVDLVDHAVDVVGELRALGADVARRTRAGPRRPSRRARSFATGKPSSASASSSFACVAGSSKPSLRADAVGEEREPALRGEARVELAQRRRRRRCADSRTSSRPPPRARLFSASKSVAQHQHLAAHFEQLRRLASPRRRSGIVRTVRRFGRHVLAGGAVAARRALHEEAVLVGERDREAVELELARRTRPRSTLEALAARGGRRRPRPRRRRRWRARASARGA